MGGKANIYVGLLCCSNLFTGNVLAETFVLNNGESVEGKVTSATNNTVLVMEENGAVLPVSLAEIREVRISTVEGDEIVGRLLSWETGIYELRSEDRKVRITNGDVLSIDEVGGGAVDPVVEEVVTNRSTKPSETGKFDSQPQTRPTISNPTM